MFLVQKKENSRMRNQYITATHILIPASVKGSNTQGCLLYSFTSIMKLDLSQLYTFFKKFNTTFLFAHFRYAFVHKKTWLGWFLSNGFLILAMFVLCLTFIVVSLLFCCHSYLMLTAQTTWEYMSRSRISYLKTLSEDVNPFDQGVFCNVYSFLCRCRVQKWEVLLRQRDRWA